MKIVILAGGVGKRLWPMSTKDKPKQFQKLISEKTMLQETYDRVSFVKPEDIYIATNAEYIDLVKEQLPTVPEENIIGEPSFQETGPCIGLTAALIAKKDPEAVMATISADHLVKNTETLQEKLELAAEIARTEGTLNIVEVIAKTPDVNLGYVEIGEELSPGVHALKSFKEKPDRDTAKKFLAAGNYLWNTGFYVWKVSTILEEFKKHLPKSYEHILAIQNGGDINEHYPKCDKISIDYGIMEKVSNGQLRIIPADLGWSDIGTWETLYNELAENEENLEKGDITSLDCKGCVIYNQGDSKIATFGLNDMLVIQSGNNTLICPKNRSSELKTLLNKLNERTN